MKHPSQNYRLGLALIAAMGCNDYNFEEIYEPPPRGPEAPSQAIDEGNGFGLPNLCAEFAPAPAAEMAIDDSCLRAPTIGSLDPILEWRTMDDEDFASWPVRTHSVTTPVVGQLTDDNGDGVIDDNDIPDIAYHAYRVYTGEGILRVISGDGSGEHWSFSGFQEDGVNYWASTRAGIAIGDLEGDGRSEVVTLDRYGRPMVFSNDGELLWMDKDADLGKGTYPALGDMDGDGRSEIVFGRAIYDAEGHQLGMGEYGTGFSAQTGTYGNIGLRGLSFPADLDLDGVMEVVAGDSLYRMDGSLITRTGGPDGFPAVGNFDDDPMAELVIVDGNSQTVFLYDYDGSTYTELWRFPMLGAGGTIYNGGPPTVADFDGDGRAEIGVAGSDDYIVLNHDGTFLWSHATYDHSSAITGSSVFDFDRDGAAEVVYADERALWILDGKTGVAKARWSDHISRTQLEYPVIADVDGDGHTEIVFVSSADTQFGEWSGVSVLGSASNSWSPGRKIWNQHAYSITNVGENGEIPTDPTPNWSSFNTFRAGHIEPELTHYLPDMQAHRPQFCLDECDNDKTFLWVDVGNAGLLEADTVEVRLVVRQADDTVSVLRSLTVNAVSSGDAQLVGPILLTKAEWASGPIEVWIDPDAALDECNVDNNVLTLTEWPCDTP